MVPDKFGLNWYKHEEESEKSEAKPAINQIEDDLEEMKNDVFK